MPATERAHGSFTPVVAAWIRRRSGRNTIETSPKALRAVAQDLLGKSRHTQTRRRNLSDAVPRGAAGYPPSSRCPTAHLHGSGEHESLRQTRSISERHSMC